MNETQRQLNQEDREIREKNISSDSIHYSNQKEIRWLFARVRGENHGFVTFPPYYFTWGIFHDRRTEKLRIRTENDNNMDLNREKVTQNWHGSGRFFTFSHGLENFRQKTASTIHHQFTL